MKTHLILFICIFLGSLKPVFSQFEYLSPRPGSTMINVGHNIIIREGTPIETASISKNLFSIVGTKSGVHDFNFRLTEDGKTLLLFPTTPFGYDEEVSVGVSAGIATKGGRVLKDFSFSFKTHREYSPQEQESFRNLKNVLLEQELLNYPVDSSSSAEDVRDITGMFTITENSNPSGGDIFFDAFSSITSTEFTGFHVITNNGDSVFSRELEDPFNFLRQKNGYFGVYNGEKLCHDVLDSNFNVIDRYYPANGYEVNPHEFQLLENGHALMIADETQILDLTVYDPDYSPNASVVGTVIQEFDAQHNLIFEWRSFDHIAVTEALHHNLSYSYIDYIHTNSIEIDDDGHIMASHRHLDQITKINRNTGEFIWRMGGVKNEFTFINEPEPFTYQHDIRRLPNGNVTLYDNGNYHSPPKSSAKEYILNEVNKKATLVWEYSHPSTSPGIKLFYFAMGSAQRLANGNTFINWGWRGNTSNPSMTEVTPNGNIVWELKLSSQNNIIAYRSHKYKWEPCARVTPSKMTVNSITDHSAKLKWSPVANAVEYHVEYKRHNQSVWAEKIVPGSKKVLQLTNLVAGASYDWRIETWCDGQGNEQSGFTPIGRFNTLPAKTALTPRDFHPLTVSIYPNPAHDFIMINTFDQPISQLWLRNVLGEVVANISVEENQELIKLPVNNLRPGYYLLEISSGQYHHIEKVCIE
ncbi:MAG: aryl-sulfate sulfotransferase [Chitinophagales bacterium]|nr:aryl-sulfate sulfotransferase [Chitinophagales bacterium]